MMNELMVLLLENYYGIKLGGQKQTMLDFFYSSRNFVHILN